MAGIEQIGSWIFIDRITAVDRLSSSDIPSLHSASQEAPVKFLTKLDGTLAGYIELAYVHGGMAICCGTVVKFGACGTRALTDRAWSE